MHRVACALVVLAASAADASPAEPAVTLGGGLSMTVGSLGASSLMSGGVFVEGGWRAGPVTLVGEATLHDVDLHVTPETMDPAIDGSLVRLGGGVRWIGGAWEPGGGEAGRTIGFDLRVDAGAALQSYAWHGGGRLSRPESWAGVAYQLHVSDPAGRPMVQGYIGFRLALADAYHPAAVSRAVCHGACSTPAGPTGYDPSWTLLLGVEWAR